MAPGASSHSSRPNIRFTNIQVRVTAGNHARPLAGNTVTLQLDDQFLTAGDSGRVDVPMVATGDIGWPADWWETEEVAIVSVFADLDQNAYFRIGNHTHAHQEIDN